MLWECEIGLLHRSSLCWRLLAKGFHRNTIQMWLVRLEGVGGWGGEEGGRHRSWVGRLG